MNTTKLQPGMGHGALIDALGGTNAVARILGIKPPSVSGWREPGIPRDKLIELAVIADTKGIVSRKDLFPDWEKIWPELVASPTSDASEPA